MDLDLDMDLDVDFDLSSYRVAMNNKGACRAGRIQRGIQVQSHANPASEQDVPVRTYLPQHVLESHSVGQNKMKRNTLPEQMKIEKRSLECEVRGAMSHRQQGPVCTRSHAIITRSLASLTRSGDLIISRP
jgi:hypothetical protein